MQSIIKQVMQHVSKTLSFSHARYFASKKTNSKIQSIAGKQIKKKKGENMKPVQFKVHLNLCNVLNPFDISLGIMFLIV